MSKLFEPSEINGMKLLNRFVRSATWEGMAADDGECTPKLVNLMAELARGGVGLIISSHAYISPEGQASFRQVGVHKDELMPGLEAMATAVHENGGKIVMQLAHAGYFGAAKLTGMTPIAPSIVAEFAKTPRKEMTVEDIQSVIQAFGAAAKRAKIAGFDGVQVHAAHGYLLSEFLSPLFNHRKDEYGGDIRNRTRALVQVFQAIRKTVGNDYPVLVKMNCKDIHENGLILKDSVQVGEILASEGIDAIELSGGLPVSPKVRPSQLGINSEEKEAYFQGEARAFKKKINVPLILVGGNRSFQVAEHLVEEGVADYISMSRPFIREPDLINRWRTGDRRKAACLSDNLCFEPAMKGDGIYCVTKERRKK
jgi:2,4-dienoyl-CoA reductase-like NADH-dependent reductase (Old Yellow Enzyme family)